MMDQPDRPDRLEAIAGFESTGRGFWCVGWDPHGTFYADLLDPYRDIPLREVGPTWEGNTAAGPGALATVDELERELGERIPEPVKRQLESAQANHPSPAATEARSAANVDLGLNRAADQPTTSQVRDEGPGLRLDGVADGGRDGGVAGPTAPAAHHDHAWPHRRSGRVSAPEVTPDDHGLGLTR